MESLVLSLEAVAPIFILMLLGYLLKQTKMADKTVFDGINKLIFNIFLPVLLFNNIYNTKIEEVVDLKLILICTVGITLIFLIGIFTVGSFTKDNGKKGVMLQGFFRSNIAFLGIPLMGYICKGSQNGCFSLAIAILVPLFNLLAVISLERFRNGKPDLSRFLKGVLTNPLIIGCAVGLLFSAAKIKLPSIMNTVVTDLSAIASPLAMVALGAGFTVSKIKDGARELILTVAVKLVILPLAAVVAAVALGLRDQSLAAVLVVFGTPVAVSSYPMAKQMGGDEDLAAQVVVISSAACTLTLFLFILALSSLGLI